jgi:hypothetical protein
MSTTAEVVKIQMRHCLRCDYQWQPRTSAPPRQCPACHSNYWDTPRPNPKTANLPKKNYILDGIVPPAPPTIALPPPPRLRADMPSLPAPPVAHMHRHTVYEQPQQPERTIRRTISHRQPPQPDPPLPEFPALAAEFESAAEQGEMNADCQ